MEMDHVHAPPFPRTHRLRHRWLGARLLDARRSRARQRTSTRQQADSPRLEAPKSPLPAVRSRDGSFHAKWRAESDGPVRSETRAAKTQRPADTQERRNL